MKSKTVETVETLEKILKLNIIGHSIVALKLNDKTKECLELFYCKAVIEDSKYYIYNTEYGFDSGSFSDNLYSEYIKPEYIIEL